MVFSIMMLSSSSRTSTLICKISQVDSRFRFRTIWCFLRVVTARRGVSVVRGISSEALTAVVVISL